MKDLFYIKGVRCTAGSRILAENMASYDSPVISRLRSAGAVIVGTTNMHEFAAGVTGENPHYGPVRNPWDQSRMSGGSSSGSAAAVAAGLAACAIGTDTAGSVRIPAALCGVVGFKPTYGRVTRLGVVPLASSFDTVGTLTSCAWDAAVLMNVLAGHDPEDLTTVSADVPDYTERLTESVSGMRIGVLRSVYHDKVDPGVEEAFLGLLDRLSRMGCTLEDIDLEGMSETAGCWRTIRLAEAASFHRNWLNQSPGSYGEDVRLSLESGLKIPAVDYVTSQNLRPSLMHEFASSMKDVDAVALPTTFVTAPRLGEKSVTVRGTAMEVRQALIGMTLPFSTVGFPAVSVPAGLSKGLPVGAQFAAGPFEEGKLLRLAAAAESAGTRLEPPRIV